MAVYKVPQDVEADDKFLGPLTFKQFLFSGGTVICGYLTFLSFTKVWPLSFVFLVPTLVFAALAFPWSKEQPTELWLASRIRFMIVPRRRIWDQTGVKDLVNVTAPVREAHVYTDGLSQNEVHDRLNALASIVDSRGWAVKSALGSKNDDSDRLVATTTVPADTSNQDLVNSTPDVFDNSEGTIASQFDNMIENSEKQHKSETLKLVEQARNSANINSQNDSPLLDPRKNQNSRPPQNNQDFWFMNTPTPPSDPSLAVFQAPTSIHPGDGGSQVSTQNPAVLNTNDPQMSEDELLQKVHEKQQRDALQAGPKHERVIDPNGNNQPAPEKQAKAPMTAPSNPDILSLSQSNDLNVETLARQANKKDLDDNEVVISLH